MQSQRPFLTDDITKAELLDLLEMEHFRNEIMQRMIANFSHEIRSPIGIIIGYANLFLESSVDGFPQLTEPQEEGVCAIKSCAYRVVEGFDFLMLVNRATFFFKEPPTKAKILLSGMEQLKNRTGLSITSDLMQASPVYADENVIVVIVEILAFHNFIHKSNEKAELSIENDGDVVRFNFSNLSQSPLSYYLEKYFDKVDDRLVCKDESWLYEPMCLVVALVEKYGGAVYAELVSNSTYNLSFTLPVYQGDD